MTRTKRRQHNQQIIERIARLCTGHYAKAPSYRDLVGTLNREGCHTADGRLFTERGLYRMLQRNGISGIWGIYRGQA